MPGPDYKTTFADRSLSIDYAKFKRPADSQSIVNLYRKNSEPNEAQDFTNLVNYVSALVNILKAKNSRVIFLRLPSGDIVRDLEEQMFPQSRFWDYMEENIDAEFIHFEDYPELAGYLSVDASQVSYVGTRQTGNDMWKGQASQGLVPNWGDPVVHSLHGIGCHTALDPPDDTHRH